MYSLFFKLCIFNAQLIPKPIERPEINSSLFYQQMEYFRISFGNIFDNPFFQNLLMLDTRAVTPQAAGGRLVITIGGISLFCIISPRVRRTPAFVSRPKYKSTPVK
jgi:hypothetical protein